jgi:quercetin dioxygenase-like cupin family protein
MSSPNVSMSHVSAQRIAALSPEAGEARWWFGGLAVIKLTSAQTEGRFSLIEVLQPPKLEVPLHIHSREDELFYLLEGKIAYRIGASEFEASAGHTIFAPRNIPHGFRGLSSEPARYLIVYSPAGFEEFVRESSQPAPSLTLPPNPNAPVDAAIRERMGTLLATKYGVRLVA